MTVPSGTVWSSLGTTFAQLQYLLSHLSSTEYQHAWLDSQFSPTVKLLGVQMAIRVYRLKCHLELVGIHGEMFENSWNTPYLRLHPLTINTHSLTVNSPPL